MPVCRECKRNVLENYQTIQTQRKDKIVICNACMEKIKEENKNARNSS